MCIALIGVVVVPDWIETRAGHEMPTAAKLGICATWWALVCGAV